jgi:hypothetical protein
LNKNDAKPTSEPGCSRLRTLFKTPSHTITHPQADPSPLPALLRRADPRELLTDREEDADKPPVAVRIPDDSVLCEFLPAEVLAAAADGLGSSDGVLAAGGAGGGAVARGGRVVLPRQAAQAALDAEKDAAGRAAVGALAGRAAAVNGLLDRPHRSAVQL